MASTQGAFPMPGTVQSVVQSSRNGPLLAAAAQLWIKPGELVMDVTYGRGLFWAVYRPERLITHDLALDGIDFRQLPEGDGSVDVIVFDPPYIPQGGRTSSTVEDFMDRYGLVDVPKTVIELKALVADGMKEASRALAPGGRLMVKCMDYVSSGRFVAARHHVVSTAFDLGLKQVDEFVHYSGLGPQPVPPRQLHSRHAHSFLCVFQAPRKARLIDGDDA